MKVCSVHVRPQGLVAYALVQVLHTDVKYERPAHICLSMIDSHLLYQVLYIQSVPQGTKLASSTGNQVGACTNHTVAFDG